MPKYKAFPAIQIANRTWPDKHITTVPRWCTVDLRDGNQALPQPMNIAEKLRMFNLLAQMGFKEIEIGFPSASQIEYDFVRDLIVNSRIPADVYVQVLTQSRKHLIERTVESLAGAKRAIIHLYNSTSEQQRRITFNKNREEIKNIACEGTALILSLLHKLPNTEVVFEYSPESFTATEIDYAIEVCSAVIDLWDPAKRGTMIINLPATVELSTPNIYADQIEYFCRKLPRRNEVCVSLHTHNDRGTGTAASELGLLAGGDRVEGTLFGNGERTGNVDLVMLALNMLSQGLDPGLKLSNIPRIREIYEETTRMTVHERHPYGGDLVFTAFSGSHQDAIKKGMDLHTKNQQKTKNLQTQADIFTEEHALWDVPYLPIDPKDIGRSYEAIIRINSQSGKGGVAYILDSEYGLRIPKKLQAELGARITEISDKLVRELSNAEIFHAFSTEYVNREDNIQLREYNLTRNHDSHEVYFQGRIRLNGSDKNLEGKGNGPIDAFIRALRSFLNIELSIIEYEEQAIGVGSSSEAAAYILLELYTKSENPQQQWGVGRDTDTSAANFYAILSALNRHPQLLSTD